MEAVLFDRLTRAFSRLLSRLLSRRGLAGALSLTAIGVPSSAEGKKKHKKHKRKKKKVKFNEFGCVDVGKFCKNDGQCCSGICEGKKCQAHDQSTCVPGLKQGFCGGPDLACITSGDEDGVCNTTTGNAGYCGKRGNAVCLDCTKDADCEEVCGPLAACILCAGCDETDGRACAGLIGGGCSIM